MLFFAVTFLMVASTLGQIPVDKCPEVSVEQNFNAAAYLGKWYEQQKYPIIWELGAKCVTANYSLNSDGTVKVYNQQINILGQKEDITGEARLDSDKGEAKLLVTFHNPEVTAPYWVLSTDYENYAVVLSCDTVLGITGETVWILTRAQNPSQDIIDAALDVVKKNNLSESLLIKTDQETCN
ncbi:apolipoprotein D [Diabrotica virgifera virgifera]|uniref:Apolipoprotein D n=1 Tax=Diabrotica virgifera virgifera TaxID=50390 RepID=A0A6P7GXE2_DIAVI|nr:apolipoprotein D [Diabrotica virgifera virgifera]